MQLVAEQDQQMDDLEQNIPATMIDHEMRMKRWVLENIFKKIPIKFPSKCPYLSIIIKKQKNKKFIENWLSITASLLFI